MYLSPKSSSSSICLLRDWARSHLYSLPGLTICNPSNKLWSFLDRLYTSNTPLYSKNRTSTTDTDFAKITKFQNLGKQRERSPNFRIRQTTRTIALFAKQIKLPRNASISSSVRKIFKLYPKVTQAS